MKMLFLGRQQTIFPFCMCCERTDFHHRVSLRMRQQLQYFAAAFIFQKAWLGEERRRPGSCVVRAAGAVARGCRSAAASTYFTQNSSQATKEQRTKAISAPNIYIHYTQARPTHQAQEHTKPFGATRRDKWNLY
jgi:hypothetical protein